MYQCRQTVLRRLESTVSSNYEEPEAAINPIVSNYDVSPMGESYNMAEDVERTEAVNREAVEAETPGAVANSNNEKNVNVIEAIEAEEAKCKLTHVSFETRPVSTSKSADELPSPKDAITRKTPVFRCGREGGGGGEEGGGEGEEGFAD